MKTETRSKILGLLLFVILTVWIIYLSLSVQRPEIDEQIKSITDYRATAFLTKMITWRMQNLMEIRFRKMLHFL